MECGQTKRGASYWLALYQKRGRAIEEPVCIGVPAGYQIQDMVACGMVGGRDALFVKPRWRTVSFLRCWLP